MSLPPNHRPAPSPPLYFVNAWVDFALVGGISIAVFTLLRFFYTSERTGTVIGLAAALVWICNWPHFSATSYRLYHSRENIRQYPLTALAIPWVILMGIFASVLYPALVAPYFVKLFLIWSPYHFSGQSLGITLIYARRSGFKVGKWERLALSTFIFGTYISQTVRSEIYPEGSEFYGIRYPGLGLPEWTITVSTTVMILGGIAFLAFAARWSVQNRRLLPLIVLLPGVTQYIWFVRSASWLSFTEFVPFFHSLQYMLIAWSMQLKEKMDIKHIPPSRRYVLTESMRWGLLNVVGGICLFIVLPFVLAKSAGLEVLFATGIITTAIQLHHFFVDGVIWKLKRKTVSSPLMGNISDLIETKPVPRGVAA